MNPRSLHALLVDQASGELPPETTELLEAWLADHPEAAAEAASVARACAAARSALESTPALVRPDIEQAASSPPVTWSRPLALAAAVTLACGLSFLAGRHTSPPSGVQPPPAPVAALTPPPLQGPVPWTRYKIAQNPRGGGLTVVRLETKSDNLQ